jgi:hypothetical protein
LGAVTCEYGLTAFFTAAITVAEEQQRQTCLGQLDSPAMALATAGVFSLRLDIKK